VSVTRPPSRSGERGTPVDRPYDMLEVAPDEVIDGEDVEVDEAPPVPRRATRSTSSKAPAVDESLLDDEIVERPIQVERTTPAAAATAALDLSVSTDADPSLGEWLQRRWLFGLAYWQALLVGSLAVALVLTRFYNLGDRAMHHDESMHAKFAWDTFRGQIYKYNPLLHGPFQFLSVAGSFWLFGATEATARAVPAIFGVALVALTFLWRRWLGTAGWLFALGIFVFSPSFIYFSRMLREDSYTATWTLLAATGLVGYVIHRRRAWFYAFCAGLAFAFATKESTYITAFIWGTFMILSFLWERGSTMQRRVIAGAVVGAILSTIWFSVIGYGKQEFANVALMLFKVKLLGYVLAGLTGLVAGAVAGYLFHQFAPAGSPSAPGSSSRKQRVSGRAGRTEGTFTTAWRALWNDKDGFWGAGTFWGGVIVFFAIFFVLFSSLFTNLPGIREGLIGSIQYWLEQHGVQRGNQPWFYYLLLLGAYETLPLVFGLVAAVFYLRRPTWFTTFLIWWWVVAWVIYSWAGEKMPWLVIHIATPMVLLAARYLGELAVTATRGVWEKRLAFGGFAVLAAWTIHTGWPVNFERPDTPRDLLVYTQTAPDVKKVMADIERISLEQTGDARGIGITVQSGTWWPFSWYLRDFKNADYPPNLSSPATKPIVLVALEDDEKNRPYLQGYTRTKYKMRWWYPEDYRSLKPSSFVDLFQKKEVRDGLWKWLMYRETTQPLGSYDFYVYMKEGIGPATATTGESGAQRPASQRVSVEQYNAKLVPVNVVAQWGSNGRNAGQFNTPRGVAIDAQGNVYIADTLNHRIQKFSRTGTPITAWGTEGNGDGQFKEPMGVAVDAQGNIYVADTWNHRIQKFDSSGRFLVKWSGQGGFWGPRGIAVDGQGNVYVTDTGNKRIQKFDGTGRFLTQFGTGGAGPGQLNEPIGIAVTTDGQMFVADTNNRRIQHLDPTGKFVAEWPVAGWQGGARNEPYLALDANGNVWASDPPNGRVIQFSPTGEVLAVAGSAGRGAGQFELPLGLVAGDALYVVDSGNHRVQAIALGQ
jgi:predicted membrane-bound mannosyltransferase/DNA-binding beta-propeller fold protein YncE